MKAVLGTRSTDGSSPSSCQGSHLKAGDDERLPESTFCSALPHEPNTRLIPG